MLKEMRKEPPPPQELVPPETPRLYIYIAFWYLEHFKHLSIYQN